MWENSVNLWLFDHRNPTLDGISHWGSNLADTVTCLAILILLFVTFRWWLSRLRESFVLLVAIVGELLVFLIVTAVVNRARPDVPHLDVAPPTSSFPSGHTAAAVVLYGCIAVIALRNISPRRLAMAVATVCCVVPFAVGASRLYRGMHHPTDVLFGAGGGGIWLLIVLATLLPRSDVASRSSRVDTAYTDTIQLGSV